MERSHDQNQGQGVMTKSKVIRRQKSDNLIVVMKWSNVHGAKEVAEIGPWSNSFRSSTALNTMEVRGLNMDKFENKQINTSRSPLPKSGTAGSVRGLAFLSEEG